MSKTKKKVTKDTNIGDLVHEHPKVVEVLFDYGLHCVGCALSPLDTLEEGSKLHGISDEEINEMVERVNEVIEHEE
jgi:hybrid cluster-associated redox disulfide protein